jgi:hypothetical protein
MRLLGPWAIPMSAAASGAMRIGRRNAFVILSASGRRSWSLHKFMIRSLPTFVVSRMIVFFEIDHSAFAVLHHAIAKNLEE